MPYFQGVFATATALLSVFQCVEARLERGQFVLSARLLALSPIQSLMESASHPSMPPTRTERLHYIEQALNTREVQVYKQTVILPDRVQFEEVRISVCTPDEVRVIVQDVSDRKADQFALMRSEAKFRHFVEQANDLIFAIATDGSFTYLSLQVEEILGYPPAQLLDQWLTTLVHPDDRQITGLLWQQVIHQGERTSGHEFRTRRRDGTWCWLVANAVPIRDETGYIVGLQGIARDIADHKLKTLQLERTLQELRCTQSQLIQSEKCQTGHREFILSLENLSTTRCRSRSKSATGTGCPRSGISIS